MTCPHQRARKPLNKNDMRNIFSRFFGNGKKRNAELHVAVQSGDLTGVREALDKGADVNAFDPVRQVTALHVAVDNVNKPMVQYLLSRGAQTNAISGQNLTPLITAASIGDRALPIVELLLAGRADPTLVAKVGPYADKDALGIAAAQGANAILRHLLTFGALPKVQANGATLLHLASIGGDSETIAIALSAGATVNDVDANGNTPLHYAVTHSNKTAVLALLDHGETPEKRNKQGQTSLDCAAAGNKPSILKLFFKQDTPSPLVTADPAPDMSTAANPTEQMDRIRGMTLLEFANEYYPNVRFQNVMMASTAQGTLPFETVGAYLDAGEDGKLQLLRLPNLGVSSISRLSQAIHAAMQQPTPIIKQEEPFAKRQGLVDQLQTRYPGVFTPLLDAYANTPLHEVKTCSELEADMLRFLNDERLAEVALRRFQGETLAVISEAMGISRERVRQIGLQAKSWITELKEEPPPPLEELDEPIPEGIKRAWFETYLRLKAHHTKHGSADVPHQWQEDRRLAGWVSQQRQKYKKNELTTEQIKLMESLNFSWSLRERGTWDDRLAELVEFKKLHGHFDVPTNYPEAPKLRPFVSSSNFQYRTGSLDTDRIMRLEEIGFVFEVDTGRPLNQSLEFTPHALATDFTLEGKTLTITGRLETLTQKEATQLAQKNGAVVVDKFSGNVDLLLVGSDPGSKLADAQRSGITLIDEKQFINIVR